MACSTCDGYEFVPDPADPSGEKIDCPDCRAIDPRPKQWCPVHSTRVQLDGSCMRCRGEALRGFGILEAIAHREALVAA